MGHFVMLEPKGRIIRVLVHDVLGTEDYEHIMPYVDSAIAEHNAVRLFFDLTQYEGREPGAKFEDIELNLPNFAGVERVGLIGDAMLEARVPRFSRPFKSAEIRYFYRHQRKAAEQWILEGAR